MSSEEQYYLGNELLGWGPDQGRSAVISPSAMTSKLWSLSQEDWEWLDISIYFSFPFSMSSFHCYWVQEEMASHISVWCVLVSGVFVVDWFPLVCRFIHRVARFSSCLFWLASQHSGVVLSNRTSCNVSVCASGLPMEVAPHPPHVTSMIEETFLTCILCILKLMHL